MKKSVLFGTETRLRPFFFLLLLACNCFWAFVVIMRRNITTPKNQKILCNDDTFFGSLDSRRTSLNPTGGPVRDDDDDDPPGVHFVCLYASFLNSRTATTT
jgi:hypothetical protein